MTKRVAIIKTKESKTRIRKKITREDPSMSQQLNNINQYMLGKTIEEIAEATGWDVESIRKDISSHFYALKNIIETENLVAQQKVDNNPAIRGVRQINLYRNQQKIDKDINKEFIEKLSAPEDPLLTQEETLFCYLMVHEGDEKKALEDAGLAGGLLKANKGYKPAVRLRCLMLKGKKNIIRAVNALQINYAKELNVNKEMIQSELVSQIRQLREQNDPKLAATIQKLTQDLGRTVGAFTEKIEVHEVSFDAAMDKMLEMREKKAKESGKPSTYIYEPEKIG